MLWGGVGRKLCTPEQLIPTRKMIGKLTYSYFTFSVYAAKKNNHYCKGHFRRTARSPLCAALVRPLSPYKHAPEFPQSASKTPD